jgi:hypothetical protein
LGVKYFFNSGLLVENLQAALFGKTLLLSMFNVKVMRPALAIPYKEGRKEGSVKGQIREPATYCTIIICTHTEHVFLTHAFCDGQKTKLLGPKNVIPHLT